jgi:hypothetical protein
MEKGQIFEAFSRPGFSLKRRTFHFESEDADFVFCEETTLKADIQIQLFKTHWDFYPKNNGQ